MADALREEIARELKLAYGDLQTAASALDIPYKTLYRALTTKGQDRSQTMKLDLVIQITEHLASLGRPGLPEMYEIAAESLHDNPDATDDGYDA